MPRLFTILKLNAALLLIPIAGLAQADRITQRIDPNQLARLPGNVNPKARPQFDQGAVDSGMILNDIRLLLKPSAEQQAALEQWLLEIQNPSSPNFHKWLSPEQYAGRFGLSIVDIGRITSWLSSEGFKIQTVARGRNWIAFSGTAEQVRNTFHTEIHRFSTTGETHFANSTEPFVPEAIANMVLGLAGLDNFPLRRAPRSRRAVSLKPSNTDPKTGEHFLAPDDLATIYNINPLYQAGFDGSGQKIAIVGEAQIGTTDIQTFRTSFGLKPQTLKVISLDSGVIDANLSQEAALDIEWAGAVARNASILYVYSSDILKALAYAIDQNLAPVMSNSFGACESVFPPFYISADRAMAQQANTQGITWLSASGDRGAADCDSGTVASQGLAVDHPASIPEVTAVGGTEFDDIFGLWWSSTNSPTGASALSYIPEIAWNDSWLGLGLAAGGGGLSTVYSQPAWQTGPGVPASTQRAIPDVSLSASGYDGYLVFAGGEEFVFGGTSASTPSFAGIIALLNQYENSNGQGNINPNLYRLAQSDIFHDITFGDNMVPCSSGTPDCLTGSLGYSAGIGYDLATGLGSVDAYKLVTKWKIATPQSKVTISSNPAQVAQQAPDANGSRWNFTIVLSETNGVGTALTDFTINGVSSAAEIANLFGSTIIPASGSLSATIGYKSLPVPTTLVFGVTGIDAGGRTWTQQLAVPFTGTQTTTAALAVSSSSLQFAYTVGSTIPPAQSVQISNSGLSFVSWSAISTAPWLVLTPASGKTPGPLGVAIMPSNLTPGSYSTAIMISAPGINSQNVTVTLTVSPKAPPAISLVPLGLLFNYTLGSSLPAPQLAVITNAGGGTLSWTAKSNASWLNVTPTTGTAPSTISISVNPSGLAVGSQSGAITITATGASNSPQTLTVMLKVTTPAPTVSITAVTSVTFNGASAVAPGSLVAIAGANLASSSASAGGGSLPTVVFNGALAPIFSVSPTLVNVQVPWETAVGTGSVLLKNDKGMSNSFSVQIAAASPGIFPIQLGTQFFAAAVNLADGSYPWPSGSAPGASLPVHPAKVGDILSIYTTGLGAVSPSVANGQPALDGQDHTPLVNPTVLIGGISAQVFGTIYIPQYVGIDLINVSIPAGVPSGPVSIQIQAGGITSTSAVQVAIAP